MILDACCGAMKFYNGWDTRIQDELVTIDIRRGDFSFPSKAFGTDNTIMNKIVVEPTILCDMTTLPFKDSIFDAIVFDPPHLDVGLGSRMAIYYGCWKKDDLVHALKKVKHEFARILTKRGFLFVKTRRKYWQYFETILNNFSFFLPIERRTGAYHRKKDANRILWAIGQLKRNN